MKRLVIPLETLIIVARTESNPAMNAALNGLGSLVSLPSSQSPVADKVAGLAPPVEGKAEMIRKMGLGAIIEANGHGIPNIPKRV